MDHIFIKPNLEEMDAVKPQMEQCNTPWGEANKFGHVGINDENS